MNASEPAVTAPTGQPEPKLCMTHPPRQTAGGNRPCGALVIELEREACVSAVLVPVTQREAEQRVIEAAKRVEVIRLGGGINVRGLSELTAAIDALAAVQGIPVDTEAGNGA